MCKIENALYKFITITIRFLYGEQAKFFEGEIKPRIKHKKRGTVSMANNGDNLHGSQVSSCYLFNFILLNINLNT